MRVEPPMLEEQELPPPPRRRGVHLTRLGRFVVLILVILLPLGSCGIYALKASHGSAGGKEVVVVIEPGSSASTIAAQLEKAGVIKAAWLFRLYAKTNGSSRSLRPGEYHFRRHMSYAAVVAILQKGPAIEFTRVTIPEGKTVSEVAMILERAHIDASDFLAEARSGTHTGKFLPDGSTNLEGFLFPKTYDVKAGTTAAQAVDLLLNQFDKETETLDWSRADSLGVTPYQVIVIASLIEREAKVPQDRAKIARVIYNRLAKHMRLEIDATVEYAIFLKTGAYKNPLLLEDLKISSPYNTYQIDALPPAPIAGPGLASIKAALEPADGKWLYYLLINDKGEHAFAETFEEFQRLKNSR